MTLTYRGRLPGVDCLVALPRAPQPIRLDVPAFVGLAEFGPVDQPTPVEDINQYQSLFGGDLVVAQNNGVPVYASLPSTVKSFFDNGGTRCYVVRVLGPNARAARRLLPGMRKWAPDGTVEDVYVEAAWPGSWSMGIEVGSQLLLQPLSVAGDYLPVAAGAPGSLPLSAASALMVAPGDLIELDFGPSWPAVYVCATTPNAGAAGGAGGTFTSATPTPPPFDPTPTPTPTPTPAPTPAPPLSFRPVSGGWAVATGAEVPVSLGPPMSLPGPMPVVSATLLRFDLVVQQTPAGGDQGQPLEQWLDLSFNPPATSFWLDVTQQTAALALSRSMYLRADPTTSTSAGFFVPLAMDELGTPAEFVDATLDIALGSPPFPGEVVGDDDLGTFDPVTLFLDPNLDGTTVYDLIDNANQLTVLSPDPIQLKGIHSLIEIDDVAMVSVPDATQLGWTTPVPVVLPTPTPPPAPPPALVDWAEFGCCTPEAAPVPTPSPKPTQPSALPYPTQADIASYDPSGLYSVQIALVELCAARSDAVAVLSVPAHYSSSDFVSWSRQFTGDGRVSGSPLSFAAAWHPWVQIVEPATPQLAPLRSLPPDGPATGTIAAREQARGVWVAPANIPLRGAVGLTPVFGGTDEIVLFNAHDNLFVPQPGVFVGLSAHTLSSDPNLLQLSVRRLLILLRKIALQQGMSYVFQTNNDRFRQMVRRRFEQLLSALAQLGALVNYQVVTDSGVNTPTSLAEGRLIVQLNIAPTSPVEFITVTLVRAGEGLLDVLEGW